jgi:hypothetical protein
LVLIGVLAGGADDIDFEAQTDGQGLLLGDFGAQLRQVAYQTQ